MLKHCMARERFSNEDSLIIKTRRRLGGENVVNRDLLIDHPAGFSDTKNDVIAKLRVLAPLPFQPFQQFLCLRITFKYYPVFEF